MVALPMSRMRLQAIKPSSKRRTGRTDNIRTPILAGFAAVAIGAGSLVVWSCTTSITSSTVVPGVVVVDTGRKAIEHLLGGTVESVMVKEGQEVVAGQPLARLNTKSYDVAIDSLQALLASNINQQARLECEEHGCKTPFFPEHVDIIDDNSLKQARSVQESLFLARRNSLENRVEAAQVDEARSQIMSKNVDAEIEAETMKISLTRAELRVAGMLAREGNGTRQRVIEVARAVAELQGELSGLQAQEANLQHDVMHEQLEVIRLRSVFYENAAFDLQQADRDHEELTAKLKTELQERDSCLIVAPVAGRVVNLALHTIGGVVAPGAPLLEIVPTNDDLVLDAKVRPSDIENITPGVPADIRLPGMVGQRMPRLIGHVVNVSADRLEDPQGGQGFFRVRVVVSPENRVKMGSYELKAGADVTVMIRKGEQPPLDYLVSPLAAFFGRSWS